MSVTQRPFQTIPRSERDKTNSRPPNPFTFIPSHILFRRYPNLIPRVPSHLAPCTPIEALTLASGYRRFRAPVPASALVLAFPAGGAPNLMPISGFHIPDDGEVATGGGATGALVGVGAVSGSSAGAGAL